MPLYSAERQLGKGKAVHSAKTGCGKDIVIKNCPGKRYATAGLLVSGKSFHSLVLLCPCFLTRKPIHLFVTSDFSRYFPDCLIFVITAVNIQYPQLDSQLSDTPVEIIVVFSSLHDQIFSNAITELTNIGNAS